MASFCMKRFSRGFKFTRKNRKMFALQKILILIFAVKKFSRHGMAETAEHFSLNQWKFSNENGKPF